MKMIGRWFHELREAAPEAHIAGGAVRDDYLGVPIKDVDVFVGEVNETRAREVLAEHFEWKRSMDESYFTSDPRVRAAHEFDMPDTPINLIVLSEALSMLENVERFDFGVCRAAHNGECGFFHADFTHDVERRCFTLRKCENESQMGLSLGRYRRLSEKFPEWGLHIPAKFSRHIRGSIERV